jgi:hypothetical protein
VPWDDLLLTYIRFATKLVIRDRLLHERMREFDMATPASISRLTEHARRAAQLLADSDRAAEKAGPVLENYAATLERFKAGVSEVGEREKELSSVLRAMGNATEVIGDTFREDAGGGGAAPASEPQTAPDATDSDTTKKSG